MSSALTYKDAFDSGHLKNYASFMLKRVARLYPAYLAIGLLYVAKIAAGLSGQDTLSMFSPSDIVGNLLMMTGWGLHIHPLMGVAWAASAEMGSYLLVPLLMLLTIRRSPLLCGLTVVAALAAIYMVSISGRGSAGPLDVTNGNSFYPMVRAVAGFTLGLAIYRFSDVLDRLSMTAQDILLACILIAIIVTVTISAGDRLLYVLFIPLVAVLSRDGRLAQAAVRQCAGLPARDDLLFDLSASTRCSSVLRCAAGAISARPKPPICCRRRSVSW